MRINRLQFSTRRMLLLIALVALPLAFDSHYLQPFGEHHRYYARVQASLLAMQGKRPANVTPEQWDHMLLWTTNLHGNCGGHLSYLDMPQAEAFADALELKVQGPVGVATIDWIWDEYMRISRLKSYNRFRPNTSENLELWGLDPIASVPISSRD